MPLFRRHLKAGVIAATLISVTLLLKGYLNFWEFPAFLVLFIVGSVFPDIDAKHSRVRLWFNRIMVVSSILLALILAQELPTNQKVVVLAFSPFLGLLPDALLSFLLKHRGFFHNPFIVGITVSITITITLGHYTFFSYYSAAKLSIGFFSGFVLHVALDKLFSWFKA